MTTTVQWKSKYEDRIHELNNKGINWIKIDEDGIPELYLDNHSLQTFRACEAHFMETLVDGWGAQKRVWFLDLGTAVHKMMEYYYQHRAEPNFSAPMWATEIGTKVWHRLNMEEYKLLEPENYNLLNGHLGFVTLCLQYGTYFHKDNERFRIIGSEQYFGHAKEVPLQTHVTLENPFRLYLTGKIDLLIDDTECVAPMDHKTKKYFGINPMLEYELHEGMTGYIYATRKLVEFHNTLSENNLKRRPTNKIWINLIQIKNDPKDYTKRFQRAPVFKTDQQLEDYRLRQIQTASKIFNLVVRGEGVPDYNTMMCQNWMRRTCPFYSVHRMDSASRQLLLNANFSKLPIWNPEQATIQDELIGDLDE